MKNKKVFKILKLFGVVIIVGIIFLAGFIKIMLPAVPLQAVTINPTTERLERGKYLFNNVAGCMECHSQRNDSFFSMPVVAGTDGKGGRIFDEKEGLPGSFTAKNITPFHLGSWSDAELFRAITSGVSKNGRALFPLMPYLHFGKADKEDIYSIITYMRTLQPISNDVAMSHSDFPMNFIINTIPQKPDFQKKPDRKDTVAYGGYLVNLASCITCHSRENKGKLIEGLQFSGGRKFPLSTGGTVTSANISPDLETGIGSWNKEMFIKKFKLFGDSSFRADKIEKEAFNTVMPWTNFGKMTEGDLAAIYAYLHTVKAVKNVVIKFSK